MPDSYFGKEWPEYYEILGRHRDSEILDNANFEAMLEKLGGESETIVVNHCGHWAVGWVETIMIHESDLKALTIADQVMKAYNNYPVIDEDLHSEMEYESYAQYAEQEQEHLAEFLAEVFTIPEEFNKELLEIAYRLNMECQYNGGEYSAFNHNIYNFRSTNDFDTRQLEGLIDSLDFTHNLSDSANLVADYIKACIGME